MVRYLTLFITRSGFRGLIFWVCLFFANGRTFFCVKKIPTIFFGLCYMLSIAVFSRPYTFHTIHLLDRLNFLSFFLKKIFSFEFSFCSNKNLLIRKHAKFLPPIYPLIDQSVNQSMDKWFSLIHARVFVHGVFSLHLNATVPFKNAVECVHVSLLDGKKALTGMAVCLYPIRPSQCCGVWSWRGIF